MIARLRERLDDILDFSAVVVIVVVLHAVADQIEAQAYARGIRAEMDRQASEAMGG